MNNPDATPALTGASKIPPYPDKPKMVIPGVTDPPNWKFFCEMAWAESQAWFERNKFKYLSQSSRT